MPLFTQCVYLNRRRGFSQTHAASNFKIMHYTFTIFKSEDKLKDQWMFLANRVFKSNVPLFRKYVLFIGSASFLYASLLLFTSVDSYVTLKAISSVLIILALLFLLVSTIVILYNNRRYNKFVERDLEFIIANQSSYKVELSEDSVKIITGIILNEYPWTDFRAYGIKDNTIYIFNKSDPLKPLFWSFEQVGAEIFPFIIEMLKESKVIQRF